MFLPHPLTNQRSPNFQRLAIHLLYSRTTTLCSNNSYRYRTPSLQTPSRPPRAQIARTTSTTTTFIGVSSSLGRSRSWKSASSYPLASASRASPPPSSPPAPQPPSMSDDKKTDDLNIELGERSQSNSQYASRRSSPAPPMAPQNNVNLNSPVLAIAAYCGSSILMTVANKYCVSGTGWNLTFFLLAVQVR